MSRVIVTERNFAETRMHIRMHSFAAIDVETTGLNAYNGDTLFCITVSTPDHDFYFDFHDGQENFDKNGEETLLDRELIPCILDGFTGTLFAHNAKFDMHFLANEGLDLTVHDIHCTESIARLENNACHNLQLATCVKKIGLEKGKEVEDYIKKNKLHRVVHGKKEPCYDQVPFEIMMPYASLDTNITLELGMYQLKSLKKQQQVIDLKCPSLQKTRNLLSLLDIEKRLTKALFRMERKGVRTDPGYTKKAYDYEVAEYKKIAEEFKVQSGIEFKDDKSTLVQAFIAAGESIPRTAKGNYCLNKDALESMTSPLAQLVKRWRRSYMMAHTYYENFMHFADKNGIIHPNFQQGGAKTGRLSCRHPNMQNCLGLKTEILTPSGYKKYHELSKGDLVATYNSDISKVEYQPILNLIFKEDDKLINLKSEHIDLNLTPDHRFLSTTKRGKHTVDMASSIPTDRKMLHASTLNGGEKINGYILMYMVACQADSYFGGMTKKGITQRFFTFTKERKVKRLIKILLKIGLNFRMSKVKGGRTRFTIRLENEPDEVKEFIPKKMFTYKFLSLSLKLRELFLDEIRHWDGLSTRENIAYCTKDKINADVVQAIASITEMRVLVSYRKNSAGKFYYYVYGTKRNYSYTTNMRKVKLKNSSVWCVTVENGLILVRSGGSSLITGNCPSKGEDTAKFPVRKCFVPLEGYLWISIDWKAMEYRLMLDYAGEMTLIDKVKMGHDVHQATGDLISMARSIAKNVNFALLYGTGNAHLGTMINKTTMEAKRVRLKYFSKLPKVKRLIENVKMAVKRRGFVITHYGRKLKVDRDKDYVGANYLIQGGCADMMKKSLVEVDEFLLGQKCQSHLTLTVHDEADLQIHLSELHLIEPIAEIMTNIYEHNYLPMAVDVEYTTTNWAELKEYKHDDTII